MHSGPPRRRRARPVADAPIDELLTRSELLAKGWLLALVEQTELEQAPALLHSGIALDGPRICAAVLRALSDDRDLARLEAGGVLEPLVGQCARYGADGSAATALAAVDALQAVLWSALRAELRDPDPELVLELSERLAAVSELVRSAAVRALDLAPDRPGHDADSPRAERHWADTPSPQLRSLPDPPEPRPAAAAPGSAPRPGAAPPASTTPGPETAPGGSPPSEPDPDGGAEPRLSAAGEPGAEREETLWVAALEAEVVHSRRGGAPLSLLLVELQEGERLLSAAAPGEVSLAFGRFAQAVRSVLRRQDLLASEDETRAWVIARDTGRAGASALGQRVAAAVRGADSLGGAPLTVSVGIAVLGEDAHDSQSLLEAAEEASFAASASGEEVGEVPEPSNCEPS